MRPILLIATCSAMLSSSASAQSAWKEHLFPDNHFQVQFPAEPAVSIMPYTAADGTQVTKTTYSVRQDSGLYQAAVVDFSQAQIDAATAIDQAVTALRANSNVTFNQAARQNGTCGRYLTLKGKDGSTSTVSLFFRDKRLYQIQGTSLPSNTDPSSGYMILFTNSFSFDVTLPYRGPCFEEPAEFFTNRPN
ncbi:MAG TPA: hypothetical protein VFW28_10790 [Micropepsaceae bacterium]|nr:hypothetical protein [Micropepsaceae bacterium]